MCSTSDHIQHASKSGLCVAQTFTIGVEQFSFSHATRSWRGRRDTWCRGRSLLPLLLWLRLRKRRGTKLRNLVLQSNAFVTEISDLFIEILVASNAASVGRSLHLLLKVANAVLFLLKLGFSVFVRL